MGRHPFWTAPIGFKTEKLGQLNPNGIHWDTLLGLAIPFPETPVKKHLWSHSIGSITTKSLAAIHRPSGPELTVGHLEVFALLVD